METVIKYRQYIWKGWLGNILTSYERGVKVGDVRSVKGTLISAYHIDVGLFKSKITWVLVNPSYENSVIQEFKKKILEG